MKRWLGSFSTGVRASCLVVAFSAIAAVFPGCASEAEKKAQTGLEAFKRCDMREARAAFDEAYTLDARSDFALAYALSDLAVLAEDPALQPTFRRLGFTADVKTDFVWGQGGILQKLSERTTTCTTLEESIRKGIPHPSIQRSGPDFLATIDPALTVGDVRAAFASLGPRLRRIAEALETSAKGSEPSFELEGGCGVGKAVVQKPELYALAALVEAFRGAIDALDAYDGAVSVTKLLGGGGATEAEMRGFTETMNAHFLHLVKPGAMTASRATFVRSLDLLARATDAASAIGSTPANALFDWKAFPGGVLADTKAYVAAARAGIATSGLTTVPRVTPELRVDLDSFFTSPVDLGKVESPIWSVTAYPASPSAPTEPPRYSISVASAPVEKLLAPRFAPATFDPNRSYEAPALEQLFDVKSTTWEAVLDPQRRFRDGYTCTSSSTGPVAAPSP